MSTTENTADTARSWWRSLDEIEDSPEFRKFAEAEFPSEAPRLTDPVSRRRFLQVMGASMALAGLAGCRWPEEEIVPFVKRPDGTLPGVPKDFASHFEVSGFGFPVLVKSYDGRPIKVDGNPDHPVSGGASDAITQASVLELYDPDRSRHVTRDGTVTSWEAFEKLVSDKDFKTSRGKGLAVLSPIVRAPGSLAGIKERFTLAFSRGVWAEYQPFDRGNEVEGLVSAAAKRLRSLPRLADADLILSLEDDLLGDHPQAVRNTRDFAKGRRAEGGRMNRLLVVESCMTVTGGMADHRYPMKPSAIAGFAADLAKVIVDGGNPEAPGPAAEIAAELRKHPGACLVTAGPSLPPQVHALVYLVNSALGNVDRTVEYIGEPDAGPDIADLCADMRKGAVDTLFILDGNPVFDAPADLEFEKALAQVGTSIRLSLFEDETSAACAWHLPRAHWLESWGDAIAYDGTVGVVQPLIQPLYGGRTPIEAMALVLGESTTRGHEIVRSTWRAILGEAGFERSWRKVLHVGFSTRGAQERETSTVQLGVAVTDLAKPLLDARARGAGLELLLRKSALLHDGRFANNGWLMETPDPVTKLVWDNAALLSVKDAADLGVETGDHLKITAGGRSVTIPVFVQPGQAKGTVTVAAGYGRTSGGRVANGAGTDVYPLMTVEPSPVQLAAVSGHTDLATTQNHHAIDRVGRKAVDERMHHLIRQATLAEYEKDPDFAKHAVHHPPLKSIWKEREYNGRKWGMMIDLSSCTGCSACVTACQSENNIPVVGKEEVLRGREMHWLRVDRYYGGSADSPSVSSQPVPCMQCENAPCEQVCPVTATVHTQEGLNDMVYNRCVGTRYCSNNCPYKVRRFNWFKNHDGLTNVQKMAFNPEVTVRSRGVMEKCTYCVQRISAARIKAKNESRPIGPDEITTACAQACPAEAITFGDLNDPESKVAKLAGSKRAYGILEELNVKPRTRYLARLKNPME